MTDHDTSRNSLPTCYRAYTNVPVTSRKVAADRYLAYALIVQIELISGLLRSDSHRIERQPRTRCSTSIDLRTCEQEESGSLSTPVLGSCEGRLSDSGPSLGHLNEFPRRRTQQRLSQNKDTLSGRTALNRSLIFTNR